MASKGEYSIYQITCHTTGRVYIGITMHGIGTRWCTHRTDLRSGKQGSKVWIEDYRLYGWDGFTVETLESVEDAETACRREWEIIADAIACGIEVYNVQRPSTCERCGRRFMGKPGRTRCSQPTYTGCNRIVRERRNVK